ncbi:MAG TPA: hypothetical protein VIS72_05785 [Anaerolineales bacterium]
MKKTIFACMVLILLLMACAPQPQTEPPPTITEQPTREAAPMTPAQTAALTHLSETLNLPVDQIALVSTEAVIWSDGCLGVHPPDVMCTQALVEGYKIVFEADGAEYELHTNEMGSAVVIDGGVELNSMIEVVLIKQLAENLGLDTGSITVVSNEPAEFGNTCLGVAMENVMCAEAITPGRIVILESDGIQYEYRISDDGRHIQPVTITLTWKREGGIAGFCDSLTVFLSGEIYGNHCKSQPDDTMGTFTALLSNEEIEQFNSWFSRYGQVSLDASDPKGVADGMTLVIEFYGSGNGKPGQPVQREIFTWAQELFQRLYN